MKMSDYTAKVYRGDNPKWFIAECIEIGTVSQGGPAHNMSEKYVFDESARNPPKRVEGIAKSNSIARMVHLRDDDRKVYWLRSRFPGGLWCRRGRYPFSFSEPRWSKNLL